MEFSFLPLPTLPDVLREVVRWNKPERDEFLQKMFLFDVGIIAVVVLSLVLRDRGQVLNDLNLQLDQDSTVRVERERWTDLIL